MYDGTTFRLSEDRVVSDLTPDFTAMAKRIGEALALYREQHSLGLIYDIKWRPKVAPKQQQQPRIVGNELVFDDE